MPNFSLEQLPYNPALLYDGSNHLVEITQSSIQTFLACPQKFVFRYMMLLRPRGISIPLVIGGAVHAGLEVLLDPKLTTPFNLRLIPALQATDQLFVRLEDRPDLIAQLGDKFEHSRAVAHACVEAWWTVNGDDLKGWKILHVEWNMRAKPGATLSSPIHERAAGKIDCVILDPDGVAWIVDHKTRGRMDNIDVLGLELDLQALWYARNYELRRDPLWPSVEGFLYDAIQKPQHRLSAAGWEDLKNRMYEAMIAAPEKFFLLQPIPISKETLDRSWDNFTRIIKNMDALSADNVYMNLTSCGDYGGCPYRPLCFAGAHARDPQSVLDTPGIDFFEIKGLHEELETIDKQIESTGPHVPDEDA